jgi:hypothetical protein
VDSLTRNEPKPDGRALDEGKIVHGELIVTCRDPATLLDPVEETFEPVAGSVEMGLKQIGYL